MSARRQLAVVATGISVMACTFAWKGNLRDFEPVGYIEILEYNLDHGNDMMSKPKCVSMDTPEGWTVGKQGLNYYLTSEGPFLQHIFIERLKSGQKRTYFESARINDLRWSLAQWPLRTAENLKRQISPGLPPEKLAGIVMESRLSDPAAFEPGSLGYKEATIDGRPGFCFDYTFRLGDDIAFKSGGVYGDYTKWPPVALPHNLKPLYRGRYCGTMDGEWLYGIEYVALARHYYGRDLEKFEEALKTFRIF